MTKAPAMDFAALAASAKKSDPIERSRSTESKYAKNPFVAVIKNAGTETMELPPVPNAEAAKEVQGWLRDAAEKNGKGLSTTIVPRGAKFVVKFAAKPKKATGEKKECPICHEKVTVTEKGVLRIHGPQDKRCKGSGTNGELPTVEESAPVNEESAS